MLNYLGDELPLFIGYDCYIGVCLAMNDDCCEVCDAHSLSNINCIFCDGLDWQNCEKVLCLVDACINWQFSDGGLCPVGTEGNKNT